MNYNGFKSRGQTGRVVSSEACNEMKQIKCETEEKTEDSTDCTQFCTVSDFLPVVFLLGLREDQIGEDERRNHGEERLPDPPENIGQT